jgi:hypothetical protein
MDMDQMMQQLLARMNAYREDRTADREKIQAETEAIRAKTKAMRDKRMEANSERDQEDPKGMMAGPQPGRNEIHNSYIRV